MKKAPLNSKNRQKLPSQPDHTFIADRHKIRIWQNKDSKQTIFAVRKPQGEWIEKRVASNLVYLRGAVIDPAQPLSAQGFDYFAPKKSGQFIVQIATQTMPGYKSLIEKLGGRIVSYVPDNAYLVRTAGRSLNELKKLPFVRAVMVMPPLLKMDEIYRKPQVAKTQTLPVLISTIGPDVAAKVADQLKKLGFTGLRLGHDVIAANAAINQIQKAAELDDVVFIGPDSTPTTDVDNARIQGGADFIEQTTASFQGQGMKIHICEGLEKDHPAFAKGPHREAPIPIGLDKTDGHGTATAGIVIANGANNPAARGIVPHSQAFFTHISYLDKTPPGSREKNSRWGITQEITETYDVDSQTQSWGHNQTPHYTEHSREMDQALFHFDLAATQSQSNTGTPASRPQAWAKNIIPITALYHYDTPDPSDDRWNKGCSTRDGGDPRIGRTLSGYYDRILTTTLGGKYMPNFGGTSGATPIVNGFINIVIQMFKEGVFKNALVDPLAFKAGKRPRAATTAALAIASAKQYPFAGAEAENNRFRQGWGFPDVKRLYESRDKLFIVNEDHPVKNFESKSYMVSVREAEPELKISLVYKDPAGVVAAGKAQINDLDLKVTAPDGTLYWGNYGLLDGNYSKPGGTPDRRDTVENVFIQNPMPGDWKIEVIGYAINEDAHKATHDIDATFALVALGARQKPTR